MPGMFGKPTDFRPGDDLTAAAINKIKRGVPRHITGGTRARTTQLGDRLLIDVPNPRDRQNIVVAHFVVIEELDDLLRCIPYSLGRTRVQHENYLGVPTATLTTRTDDSNGIVTLDEENQGEIQSNDRVDMFWPDGQRIDIDVTTASVPGTTVGITGGTGAVLPSQDEHIWFVPQKSEVFVAKPRWLQRFPWEGVEVATNGHYEEYEYENVEAGTFGRTRTTERVPYGTIFVAETVDQEITPSYFPGDVITAYRLPTGYEYIAPFREIPSNKAADDENRRVIVWEDLNEAGRHWADEKSVSQGLVRFGERSLTSGTLTHMWTGADEIKYNDGHYSDGFDQWNVFIGVRYRIGANVIFAANATGARALYLGLYNSTTFVDLVPLQEVQAPGGGAKCALSGSVDLLVDWAPSTSTAHVKVLVRQDSGGALTINPAGGGLAHTWLERLK